MSLNIKNERTHALVRELAVMSGMSQTEAVEDAVRRRIAQLSTDSDQALGGRLDRAMALAAEVSSGLLPTSFDDVNEWLYDENGLPR
jgi:antitoxin VapB